MVTDAVGPSMARRRLGWRAGVYGRFSFRYRRLIGELCVAEVELRSLAAASGQEPEQEKWAADVNSLLDEVWKHVREGDLDAGWRLLHAARRRSYHALQPEARRNEVTKLLAELPKISSSRRAAAEKLLSKAPSAATLEAAAGLRDEHFDNEHYKLRLLTTQLTWLLSLLAIATGAVVLVSVFFGPSVFVNTRLQGRGAAVIVVGSGLMGACMSAVLGLGRARRARVPTELMQARLTLARPLIGAAAGVVSVGAVMGEVVSFVSTNTPALALLAFASGFSERIILSFVERVGPSVAEDAQEPETAASKDKA